MKGVIVQTGKPKSIVLLNNGKIIAIPTPPDCRVGMVVTVKMNSLLKIILLSLTAVLVLALGIFIGAVFFNNSTVETIPNEQQIEQWRGRRGHGHRHMMELQR